MKRVLATCVALGLGVAALQSQQNPPPTRVPTFAKPPTNEQPLQKPQAPVFKAGVDLIHLDVAVLDRDRKPVRGLVPADFTILEDGKPQQLAVFSAVDIPDVEIPKTAWLRDVAPDVRSNEGIDQRRLFLIIVDDAMIEANAYALAKIREMTKSIVDKFGPSDLAAVVFTMDNRKSVDFTDDRARLLSTIKTQPMGFRGMGGPGLDGDFLYRRYSTSTVKAAVDALASMTDRRRAIIYVGGGVPVNLEVAASIPALGLDPLGGASAASQQGDMSQLAYIMSQAFLAAARANVSIYTMDICGLRTEPPPPPPAPTCVPGLEVEYLRTVAAATGGRAVVDTNDFKPGLDAIFVENSSYYLLGYQSDSSRMDGKLRRLDVRVNRPGVFVRTRNGFVADKPADVEKRRAALAKDPVTTALSSVVPKGDLPMTLSAVPFAIPGKKEAAVAIMLGVRQPIRESETRLIENVDLQVNAFNTDGKSFGSTRLRASVTVRAGATGLAEYEVLAKLELKPGRYQLRSAVSVGALTSSGSLYYDIDVPNFSDDAVSLSGLVITATPSVIVAPRDALKTVIPVVPTTRRSFGPGSQVSAFLRVYLGGKAPAVTVPLRIQLKNDEDVRVLDRRQDVAASSFGATRSSDVLMALPIDRLQPGQYLLTIDTTVGKTTASRHLRFSVVR